MNNTKNRKNVRNAGNANSTRTFVISDPDAKATDNQRRAIAHAVKNGSLPRFAEEEWKNLTKGRASEIIDELRTREGDPLATWGQKKRCHSGQVRCLAIRLQAAKSGTLQPRLRALPV